MANTEECGLLKAIQENPDDTTSRLVYADWLEEQGRAHEALQQRVKAGVSEVRYQLRRKSDGLFSDGSEGTVNWSTRGRAWSQVSHLKGHLTLHARRPLYGHNTPWTDLEVVVLEVRPQLVGTLPFSLQEGRFGRKKAVIDEPPGTRAAPPVPAEAKAKRGRRKS
jgi:uncharacterized protein (TIGR02996 family)